MGADSGQCAGLRSSCDGRGAERCAGLRGSCDGDVQSLLGERALLQGPGLRQGHHIVQPGQQGLQWGQEEQRQWGRAWDVEGQCCGANVHCPAAGDSAATLGGPAAAEAARAAAAGPSHVYLVFSAKSLDELRLLGPELLDAAYGWVGRGLGQGKGGIAGTWAQRRGLGEGKATQMHRCAWGGLWSWQSCPQVVNLNLAWGGLALAVVSPGGKPAAWPHLDACRHTNPPCRENPQLGGDGKHRWSSNI